jgi:hypothetical protein
MREPRLDGWIANRDEGTEVGRAEATTKEEQHCILETVHGAWHLWLQCVLGPLTAHLVNGWCLRRFLPSRTSQPLMGCADKFTDLSTAHAHCIPCVQKSLCLATSQCYFFNPSQIQILCCFALSAKRASQSHCPTATPFLLSSPPNPNPLHAVSQDLRAPTTNLCPVQSQSAMSLPPMALPEVRCNNRWCVLLARLKLLLRSIDSRTNVFTFIQLLILFFCPPGPFVPITSTLLASVAAVRAKNHVASPLLLPFGFLLMVRVV